MRSIAWAKRVPSSVFAQPTVAVWKQSGGVAFHKTESMNLQLQAGFLFPMAHFGDLRQSHTWPKIPAIFVLVILLVVWVVPRQQINQVKYWVQVLLLLPAVKEYF